MIRRSRNVATLAFLVWSVIAGTVHADPGARLTPKIKQFLSSPRSSLALFSKKEKSSSGVPAQHRDFHPHQLMLPLWLRRIQFPSREALSALKNSKVVTTCLSVFQIGIIVVLAIEVFRAVRDLHREFMEETSSLLDHNSGSNNPSAVLSQTAADSLVNWLDMLPQERGPHPRSVPSWMVALAFNLKNFGCGLSNKDLTRILSRLSKAEAQMLQTCLLKSSGRFDIHKLQGLDYVRGEILSWLRHNSMSEQFQRTSFPSPYTHLIQHGRQGMGLWGPPGCGKSTLIKAIAHEAKVPTLVVTPSLLQRKFYGESTNQVRTLFSLISTLGPCIVVLDELDGLFRSRGSDDHEAGREMKTEFLQWWDGVVSDPVMQHRVLIVGATNRPWDVDPAVWRRLPLRYYIGAPDWNGRYNICYQWISDYRIPTTDDKSISKFMADNTNGYTTSDLFQILQTACQTGPMSRDHSVATNLELTLEDVRHALQMVSPTLFSDQYLMQLRKFLSPQDVQRNQSAGGAMTDVPSEDAHVWRTPVGNFYQINIPVDSQVFDALNEMWLSNQVWESSSDDEDVDDNDDISGNEGSDTDSD